MHENDADKDRGLYHKFDVTRTDGSSAPGGKHENCRYFVLDLDHDPFADECLRIYAQQCRRNFPTLADDITSIRIAKRME
jgi:hypothetical protein